MGLGEGSRGYRGATGDSFLGRFGGGVGVDQPLPVYKKEKYSIDFFQQDMYELHDEARSVKLLCHLLNPSPSS